MIIKCPNCKEEISSRADKCVHCGVVFGEHCKECGAPLNKGDKICGACGCPADYGHSNNRKNISKVIVGFLISFFIIVILVGFGVFFYQKQLDVDFINNYASIVPKFSYSSTDIDRNGELYRKVWYNSIWKSKDDETDPYTRKNDGKGAFYDDFNDALLLLDNSPDYKSKCDDIIKTHDEIVEIMQNIIKPSDRYLDIYIEMKKCYDDYLDLYHIVIHPGGESYNSYEEKFKNRRGAFKDSLLKLMDHKVTN